MSVVVCCLTSYGCGSAPAAHTPSAMDADDHVVLAGAAERHVDAVVELDVQQVRLAHLAERLLDPGRR